MHENRLLYPVMEDEVAPADTDGLELNLEEKGPVEIEADVAVPSTTSLEQTEDSVEETASSGLKQAMQSLPDKSEVIEMCIGPVILSQGKRRSLGWLYLSSFRLVAMSQSLRYSEGSPSATPPATSQPVSPFQSSSDLTAGLLNTDGGSDINLAIPHGLLGSINLEISSRSHYSTQVSEVATPQAKNKRVS
jgi:hypothetical protein